MDWYGFVQVGTGFYGLVLIGMGWYGWYHEYDAIANWVGMGSILTTIIILTTILTQNFTTILNITP